MTVIRSERLVAEQSSPGDSDVEPLSAEQRAPEKLGEADAAAAAFEGEIREFVRRDVSLTRRARAELEQTADPAIADSLNALTRRISSASMQEIDRVILELQGVRDMLRSEGDRVTREIAGYASLSHAAMTAMKVIGDSLTQWRNGQPPGQRSAG